MKPYGRVDHVSGGSKRDRYHWKRDYHCHNKNHRKIGSWLEDFSSNCRTRSWMKQLFKKKINSDID